MTGELWVDYAWQHPDPSAIVANGDIGVLRYLSPDPSKNISRSEVLSLQAVGLRISLVWESTATRATQGYAAGVADAQSALSQARAVCCPDGVAIFAAVDESATVDSVRAYFDGWNSVMGARAGSYGSAVITQAHLTPWTWQTVAWSSGVMDQQADLYQRAQMTRPLPGCDEDVELHEFPVWMPDNTVSTSGGLDMALTSDDANVIWTDKFVLPDGSTIAAADAIKNMLAWNAQARDQLAAIKAELDAIKAQVSGSPAPASSSATASSGISDADVQKIAAAVAQLKITGSLGA